MFAAQALFRQFFLVECLNRQPLSYEDLEQKLNEQLKLSPQLPGELAFGQRTLQRDIKEIEQQFGIEIAYSKSLKAYHLVNEQAISPHFVQLKNAFHRFNLLQQFDSQPLIQFDQMAGVGIEQVYLLAFAMAKHFTIRFTVSPSLKVDFQPYSLKEVSANWYLSGQNAATQQWETHCLADLEDLYLTNQKFNAQAVDNELDSMNLVFDNPDGDTVKVVLQFDTSLYQNLSQQPFLPESQTLKVGKKGIKLQVTTTHSDALLPTLLSYGSKVKVLEPRSLVKQVKKALKKAIKQY
jgi:predicted DNA-binding transcriptional regulator YafY